MNSQYFSKEQVEAGELNKLLEFLMSEAYGAGNHLNDIHIYPEDCGAFVVEWAQVPWGREWGGHFAFINEDEVVMKEVYFPDSHFEYMFEDEVKDRLKEWHNEHPEWVETEYGTWTNEKENKLFKEYLEGKDNDE